MRIAISGTACQGKSTLIKDFLTEWKLYTGESQTYRDILKEKNYPHSKQANKEGQWAILNHMLDEMQKYGKKDKVIFDRCPLDNIIYSLWAFEKNTSDIDKPFIDKCIPLIRESLKFLDIIFFIPITKAAPVEIVDDGIREIDNEYITEIDNIFKTILHSHHIKPGSTPFLPSFDCPAIIEVFGSKQERIHIIKQYLDIDGDLIGDNNAISPADNSYNDMNDLLKQLENQNAKDVESKRLYNKFKL